MQLHEKNWRSTHTQAPRIQKRDRFRCSNIVQTFRLRGHHLCSKFAKIPHVGCARTFKVLTLSRGPPHLEHNIDSCITLLFETHYYLFEFTLIIVYNFLLFDH